MNTETIETEEIHLPAVPVTTSGPNTAPILFDLAKADIEHMRHEAESLTITGPDDKAGFENVYKLRQVVKKQRVLVEKRAKELKAPHIQYNREVDSLMKELAEPMTEIEDGLSRKETTHIVEKERIAREAMLFQQQRTEARVNQLRAYGFEWNARDESYDFIRDELSLNIRINFDDIKEFSDEEYESIRTEAYTAHQMEVKLIAQQVEAKRIEDERLAAIAKAEREELNRLRAQQAEAERIIREAYDREAGLQMLREKEEQKERDHAEYLKEYEREQKQIEAQAKAARKADRERVARLKPEKKDFANYLKLCYQTTDLNFQQPEIIELLDRFSSRIKLVVDEFRAELDAL